MAHDQTQPKNQIIFVSTLLTGLTLLVLGPLFTSYFARNTRAELERKVLSTPATDYQRTRDEALAALRDGPTPIDRAVELLRARGRAASPAIVPVASEDVGPLEGWMLAKDEAAAARARDAMAQRKAAEEAARAAEGGAAAGDGATLTSVEPLSRAETGP